MTLVRKRKSNNRFTHPIFSRQKISRRNLSGCVVCLMCLMAYRFFSGSPLAYAKYTLLNVPAPILPWTTNVSRNFLNDSSFTIGFTASVATTINTVISTINNDCDRRLILTRSVWRLGCRTRTDTVAGHQCLGIRCHYDGRCLCVDVCGRIVLE